MNKIQRLKFYIKKLGVLNFLYFMYNKYFSSSINIYSYNKNYFQNTSGIEIGGPSKYFEPKSIFPIYTIVQNLDCINFSTKTLWEGDILTESFNYCNNSKTGKQFILDAVNISSINSNSYDFVISCNNLEHIANPIKAIKSWLDVLKVNGVLTIIVPNNLINFDHKRKSTSFEHILLDFKSDIDETDLTHVDEILSLHDLSLDPLAGSFSDFEKRCYDNYQNRAMHHHVYDKELLYEMFIYLSIEIIDFQETPNDFFIIGMKKY
jgi:SAM-dependent methyltransferase